MITKIKDIIQSYFGTVYAFARRFILLEEEPHNAPSPFQSDDSKLHQLLRRNVKLVEENVQFRTSATARPYTFYIKVLLMETTDAGPKDICWNVITKVMGPINKNNKKAVNSGRKLEREIFLYSSVIKSFDTFQRAWPAVEIKFSDLFPICYGSASSMIYGDDAADHSATIVLQNLEASSYHFISEPCNFPLARLIVERLAVFHATPIAMAMQTNPNCFYSMIHHMLGGIAFDSELDDSEEFCIISDIFDGDPEFSPYLESISQLLYSRAQSKQSHESRYVKELTAWTTTCHCRCSMRKIMHRPEHGDDREDIKFVDPRYMNYGSCVTDLFFFMLTSLTKDVLDTYFDAILQAYFSEFARIFSIAYIQLAQHTYENFVAEFERRAQSNIGSVLFEIRRIHFDGLDGLKPIRGLSYETKLKDVISFVRDKGWLECE